MAIKLVPKQIRLIGCIVSSAVLMQPGVARSDNLSMTQNTEQQSICLNKRATCDARRFNETDSKNHGSKTEIVLLKNRISRGCEPLLISQTIEKDASSRVRKKLTKSVIQVDIHASRQLVWEKLTDFDRYAEIFKKRLQSCKITRVEGNLVFTESFLKPSFFVKEPCQHTINDLSAKPHELKWHVLDGNFRSVQGTWQLSSTDSNHCRLIYTMEVDAGPVIPRPLVSFILKMIQREVISSIKLVSETAFIAAKMKALENPTTTCEPIKHHSPG